MTKKKTAQAQTHAAGDNEGQQQRAAATSSKQQRQNAQGSAMPAANGKKGKGKAQQPKKRQDADASNADHAAQRNDAGKIAAGQDGSIPMQKLVRPYVRRMAYLDVSGNPRTVVAIDTIDDAEALMRIMDDGVRYEYNGRALRVPKLTKDIASAIRDVGWYMADKTVTDRHAVIRFVVMMSSYSTGNMLCDGKISKSSLKKSCPMLVACLVTKGNTAGSQQQDGTALHVLCERHMSQIGVPLRPSVARDILASTPRHMKADGGIVGIMEFADAVSNAIAMCAVRSRSGSKASRKDATVTSCLDVLVKVGNRSGVIALNKALCLMKLRDAGTLPFDAYGQRIVGAFVDKNNRWNVTYAPTTIDTFLPYLATIDHVMPQHAPSSVDALCNMALMMQASNLKKNGQIIGARLPSEPSASIGALNRLLMGLTNAGKSGLGKETVAAVSEYYAYEALECLKYLYRPCGIKSDWVTPVRKKAATTKGVSK